MDLIQIGSKIEDGGKEGSIELNLKIKNKNPEFLYDL